LATMGAWGEIISSLEHAEGDCWVRDPGLI
jgi:hypothetical protein